MSLFTPIFKRMVGPLGRPLASITSAAALLALATSAQAVVVVTPASNIAVPLTTGGVYVNVLTGANGTVTSAAPGWDINLWGTTATTSPLLFDDSASVTNAYVISVGGQVASLATGTSVGAASAFGGGAATTTADSSYWKLNATNYFGFRFFDEVDGRLHYGYATVLVGSTLQDRTIGNLYYESVANAPITIGAVAAVPEPAAWALMLGGLAAAGTVARRRSKEA